MRTTRTTLPRWCLILRSRGGAGLLGAALGRALPPAGGETRGALFAGALLLGATGEPVRTGAAAGRDALLDPRFLGVGLLLLSTAMA